MKVIAKELSKIYKAEKGKDLMMVDLQGLVTKAKVTAKGLELELNERGVKTFGDLCPSF